MKHQKWMYVFALLGLRPIFASQITWDAISPANDLNTAANWSPATVPGPGVDALFDSSIAGIDLTPTATGNFTADSFTFNNSAQAFTFHFNNCGLTFTGFGIQGALTNTSIFLNNTDNASALADQLTFAGSPSLAGTATFNLVNSVNYTGGGSNVVLGSITDAQLTAPNGLTLSSGGSFTISNSGTDASTGTGNNQLASIAGQAVVTTQLTAGNNNSITLTNSGVNNNTTNSASTGNAIGFINNGQLNSGDLTAGDFFTLTASNSGTDTSIGLGANNIGSVANNQIGMGVVDLGSNANFTATNSGVNSGTNTGSQNNIVGLVNAGQIVGSDSFTAVDFLNISATNTGQESSTGLGNNTVGKVVGQVSFDDTLTVGDFATITLLNSGTLSSNSPSGGGFLTGNCIEAQFRVINGFQAGNSLNLMITNTGNDSSIGQGNNTTGSVDSALCEVDTQWTLLDHANINIVNQGVITGSSSSSGSSVASVSDRILRIVGNFQAGDFLNLTVTNSGTDQSSGTGGHQIGYCDSDFGAIIGTTLIGSNATILFENTGTFSGSNTNSSDIGTISGQMFEVGDTVQAGDSFNLTMTNTGTNSGTGTGSNNIGFINGGQFQLDSSFTIGSNGKLTLSNSGDSSNTSPNNRVGYLQGKMLGVNGAFQAGDNFTLNLSNSGIDTSTSTGGNSTGFVSDNQAMLSSGGSVGSHVSFTFTNTGSYTGSNSSLGEQVGVINNPHLSLFGPFTAGDFFTLTASNEGTDSGSGVGSNIVGLINDPQVETGDLTLGNNALITISNTGNSNTTSPSGSQVGVVSGDQFTVGGAFSAGDNLIIKVSNKANVTGSPGSLVGQVQGNQIAFNGTCQLGNGTFFSASNLGTGQVTASQINFQQGFSLTGTATFQAINEGTILSDGIFIGGGVGGDVNIILSKSSLKVDTTLPDFTIGQLNGDALSTATSKPILIINTDPGVNATFAGAIQDFPAAMTALFKTGSGTQKLSGINTLTGPTTVDAGTLILNGSLAGPLFIETAGTLKGTGTVVGAVINDGTISPGESIGTLTFLSTFFNNGGTYDVEVNGAGQSDLILVSGAATLIGGPVVVSTVDGTFRFATPYTILQAASVTGTFAGATTAAFVTPTLTYDPQHVFLTLAANLTRAADTSNQRAIAQQLDGITNPNPGQQLVIGAIASLPPAAARRALDSLSGYQHTFDWITTGFINRQFIRRLYDPIRNIVTTQPDCCCCCSCCCNNFTVWLEGGASHLRVSGNHDAPHGLSLNGGEVTFGIQDTFCSDFTIGVAGSYDYEHFYFKDHTGSGQSKTWLVGAYGLYRPSCYYALLDFAYGHSSNNLRRKINVGGIRFHAISHPHVHQFDLYGEVGMDWCFCDILFQPFIGCDAEWFHRGHVTESQGAGFGLRVRERHRTSTYLRVGTHLTSNWDYCFDMSLDVAWNVRLSSDHNKIREQFIDFGTPFDIKGVKMGNNSVDYALTISQEFCDCWRAYIQGSGETWNHAQEFNFLVGIELGW